MKMTRREVLLLGLVAVAATTLQAVAPAEEYKPLPFQIGGLWFTHPWLTVRYQGTRLQSPNGFITANFKTERDGRYIMHTAHVPGRDAATAFYLMVFQGHMDANQLDIPEDTKVVNVMEQHREEMERLYGPAPTTLEGLRERVGPNGGEFIDFLMDDYSPAPQV